MPPRQPYATAPRRRLAYPKPVETLIERLASLPGVGRRSAERLALHILKSDSADAKALARSIEDAKTKIRNCRICSNLSESEACAICEDPARDRALVLVVEQPKDLMALEETATFKGIYHVLLGRLNPLEGVGPGDLTINDLLDRVKDPAHNAGGTPIREIVLGLNPTFEGDGTAVFLAQELHTLAATRRESGEPELIVSGLARGLPMGAPLEYANKAVLADAIAGRRRLE
ncbi:MAG: recombination protein RecR [Phycisphaerales bacterium]|nr:MAG: recombination protein RecR [Phycisphaerales bacterium]